MSCPITTIGRRFFPDQRMVYYLSLLGFFAIFSTTISKNPVLPLFSHALGADDAVFGLSAAVSPLAGILFSFPVGVLSDHIGKRRLLIASGVVFLSAPFLTCSSPTLPGLSLSGFSTEPPQQSSVPLFLQLLQNGFLKIKVRCWDSTHRLHSSAEPQHL